MDEEKLQEVADFRTSGRFTPRERVALELAEAMTITGEKVSDEVFARLREHFSEAAVVQLAGAIALENFRSKLNAALGVESQGFCILPKRSA